jgi:FMN-dependent NADH-azoreductase
MSLFRLDASIRVEGSHSRAIADIVEQEWRNAHPGEAVVPRHLGVNPIPATSWATAVFAGRTPEESRTDEQQAALALAATLTEELIAADAPRSPRPHRRPPEAPAPVPVDPRLSLGS